MKPIGLILLIIIVCTAPLFAQDNSANKQQPVNAKTLAPLFFNQDTTALVGNASLIEDVGYEYQKKTQVIGSVSSVDTRDIHKDAYATVFDYLRARVPGVMVFSNGPGVYSVSIRGISSFGNSSPLLVLDGTPMPDLNVLLSVNPGDIKSVEVLKDAGAASIYGVRATGGVIVIDTKK